MTSCEVLELISDLNSYSKTFGETNADDTTTRKDLAERIVNFENAIRFSGMDSEYEIDTVDSIFDYLSMNPQEIFDWLIKKGNAYCEFVMEQVSVKDCEICEP